MKRRSLPSGKAHPDVPGASASSPSATEKLPSDTIAVVAAWPTRTSTRSPFSAGGSCWVVFKLP
jgi:hypothetical protein